MQRADAVVIGAGFYGSKIAIELKALGLGRVIIIDMNPVGSQATTANQNRIHGGYHYPRSIVTAASARKNYLRFLADHAATIRGNKRHVYAIGEGSFTSPQQFEGVCKAIGAPLKPILDPMFSNKVLAAYEVDEVAFDIAEMKHLLVNQMRQARVERMHGRAQIIDADDMGVVVAVGKELIEASYVFNCAYGNIDEVGTPILTKLKKEWTEVAIIEPPVELWETDITVMDGPYWSLMAYPSMATHALTHVKYTPHFEWFPPCEVEGRDFWMTQSAAMIADAARYVPAMEHSFYKSSLVTTRVVLAEHEPDDGRPVLWEHSPLSPRVISVLGSKFNSIYDALDKLREGAWRADKHTRSVKVAGRRALIGRGFVGSNLDKPGRFTDYYNSENYKTLKGHYHQIMIAAPTARKYWANENGSEDLANIHSLMDSLSRVTADDVVLISTIDVHGNTIYGHNRMVFERHIRAKYPNARILRLPALFGPGLKKNALYDLLHGNYRNVHANDWYQWYNVEHLYGDLKQVKPGETIDIVPAPVSMQWIADQLGLILNVTAVPMQYDHRTPAGMHTKSEERVKDELLRFLKKERP